MLPTFLAQVGGGGRFEVLHPITNKPVKVPSRGWITRSPKRMKELMDDDLVHFAEDENAVPCLKSYLKDKEDQTPYSVFYKDGRAASKRLRSLMDGHMFDFPKDEFVLKEIIEMVTEGEDIILDFFAGSSTTAHSVMLQNAADGGNRRYIMVQLPETVNANSAAFSAGYKTISEVSRERIIRAGNKILEENGHPDWKRDVGFRVLVIDTSNMKDVFYIPSELNQKDLLDMSDTVKEDRSDEDLLFQVMVDWGIELSSTIRQKNIKSKTVFFVNENTLVACFDNSITEKIAMKLASCKPLRIVFRDSHFDTDATKINIQQIIQQYSSDTEVKNI